MAQLPLTAPFWSRKFKAYERKRGRTPADKAEGKIIIDIDLVEYAGHVVDRQEYDSPHFRRGLSSLGR